MDGAIRWLRISYWTGAVADGFFAVALVRPALWGLVLGLPRFAPDPQHRLDRGVAASLMLSWTILLLWADRKPLERKGILLLTVFPALVCLALTGIVAVATGATSLSSMLPIFVMQSLLAILFFSSWFRARRAERAHDREASQ